MVDSLYQIKQSLLPVLTDWSYTGDEFHQSAKLKLLGLSGICDSPSHQILNVPQQLNMCQDLSVPKRQITVRTYMQAKLEAKPSGSRWESMQVRLFHRETEKQVFAYSFCTEPGCVSMLGLEEGAPAPLKNCLFVCYSPIGLFSATPIGNQSQGRCGPSSGSNCKNQGSRLCKVSF